ncbi:MAG: replicative DNA helicase [Clostridia bacterium]|nr:replicative DNA helicase [Clostridia bacterium]MDH7573723.1 replicative DNA helicase [Clostridia bacterium]
MADLNRPLPHSLEAEQAVLGAMLVDREAIYLAVESLRPEDFYHEAHRLLFQAIIGMGDRGEAVDLVTVVEELRRLGWLEKVGGMAYVASLGQSVPSASNTPYYARIVREKALLRGLIQVGQKIIQRCYEEGEDPQELLDEAERMVFALGQREIREGLTSVKELIAAALERLERLSQNQGEVTGLPTFKDLDRLLAGLQPSDLIICAARPGMGKSSFCLNIAQSIALRYHLPVAIFSLEMSKAQVAERLIASTAMIDQHRLRTGYLTDEDWERLSQALGTLAEAPIYIDDSPAATVLEVRAKTRRLQAERGLGLVVVDYLQLMRGHGRFDNRQQEIAQISRGLKGLAREINVPVLVLSQLNRGVEQRQDKRPIMADLLESGAIEADADVVLFLYRPEYYDPHTDRRGIAEVIVAKHRNGPVGTVELAFLPEYTKFVDLAREEDL